MANKNWAVYNEKEITVDGIIDTDQADWFDKWEDAFTNASERAESLADGDAITIASYDDGDCLCSVDLRMEDGDIHQYKNGDRLWA